MESGQQRTTISVEHTLKISKGLLNRAKDVSTITASSQNIAEDTINQEQLIASINEKTNQNAEAIQLLAKLMTELTQSSKNIHNVTKEYETKANLFKS